MMDGFLVIARWYWLLLSLARCVPTTTTTTYYYRLGALPRQGTSRSNGEDSPEEARAARELDERRWRPPLPPGPHHVVMCVGTHLLASIRAPVFRLKNGGGRHLPPTPVPHASIPSARRQPTHSCCHVVVFYVVVVVVLLRM